MGSPHLSRRAVVTTAVIWVGIFLVFTTTAVALALTSNRLFVFLILAGLITSTLIADFYVTKSSGTASHYDPLSEQELHTSPAKGSPYSVILKSTTQSVPCLCIEREVVPRRSFSSPLLARLPAQRALTPSKEAAAAVPHSSERDSEAHDAAGTKDGATRNHQEAPHDSNLEKGTAVGHVRGVDVDFRETQHAFNLPSASSSETSFNCSPDMPAFWKDEASSTVDSHGHASSRTTTPVLSQSPMSSAAVTPKDSEHRYLREAFLDSGPHDETTLQDSASSLYKRNSPSVAGWIDGIQQPQGSGELWRTPEGSPLPASLGPIAGLLEDIFVEKPPRTIHAVGDTPALASAQAEPSEQPRGKEEPLKPEEGDNSGKQKSRRKLKFFPRLFKAKKEFSRLK